MRIDWPGFTHEINFYYDWSMEPVMAQNHAHQITRAILNIENMRFVDFFVALSPSFSITRFSQQRLFFKKWKVFILNFLSYLFISSLLYLPAISLWRTMVDLLLGSRFTWKIALRCIVNCFVVLYLAFCTFCISTMFLILYLIFWLIII